MTYLKLIILFSFLLLFSCKHSSCKSDQNRDNVIPAKEPGNDINIECKTFYAETTGWGYDVFVNGKQMIHQPNIPCISGNKGFTSEDKAKKTADFVSGKIKRNIIPPVVSLNELDSLGVLK